MSIELQLRSSILKEFMIRTVQERFFTTCLKPIELDQGTIYIDHLDVGQSEIQIFQTGPSLELRIPIDVYLVERQSLLSAPNVVPLGATTKSGIFFLIFELTISSTIVNLQYKDLDLGTFGGIPANNLSKIKDSIRSAVSSLALLDLRNLLTAFGFTSLRSSDVVLVSSNIAIRFDPVETATDRTLGSQTWGLFVDARTVEQIISRRIQQPGLQMTPHWRPRGTTPYVEIDLSVSRPLPDPLAGQVDAFGKISCGISIIPSSPPQLRNLANWALDRIELHTDLPGIAESAIESIATSFIESQIQRQFDPTRLGGTRVDDHTFFMDTVLPNLSFGGAALQYTSILASPEGMTLGGIVRLPTDPGYATVDPTTNPFSQLYGPPVFGCNSYAPKKATINQVTSGASVWMQDGRSICGWEVISPSFSISPYVTTDGTVLHISLPALVILGISEPVFVLVQTPRGVRLIDLGQPPQPILNSDGGVINVIIDYIDLCEYIPIEQWKWLTGQYSKPVIQQGPDDGPGNPVPPPGDWSELLNSLQSFAVQLITLTDLQPSELIQFRSSNQVVDITANMQGQVILPVLLPFLNMREQMFSNGTLIRVNRLSLQGHVTLNAVVFERQANLLPSQNASLDTAGNSTIVTTQNGDHFDMHEISPLGVMKLQQTLSSNDAFRNTNSEVKSDITTVQKHFGRSDLNLPGVAEIVKIPGFADASVALAIMTDGTTLILDLADSESIRVSGNMIGSIGNLEISDTWAVASGPLQTIVYRMTRV
jgi:hypothetical protein